MSTAIAEKLYTPGEYLGLEREAPYKSEYYNCRIFAMSGAKRAHNVIAWHVAGVLHAQLRGRPCEAYGSDMRVRIPESNAYCYPDATVACGEILFEDDVTDTLLNPVVIVGILSKSTEAFDRGDKFAHYRRIASLREYLLISQHKPRIERYLRQGEDWRLTEFDGMEAVIDLPSIQCTLKLSEVYDKVQFPPLVEETGLLNGER